MAQVKILVADNDPDFRVSLVRDVLEQEGYEVFQAESPDEAKQVLEKELIHLAIIDLRLTDDDDPEDRSGLLLIKEMDPTVARIVLTGYPPRDVIGGTFPNNRH